MSEAHFEAIISGNLEVLETLRQVENIETIYQAGDKYTLLHQAAHYGSRDVTKLLLSMWKNINLKDDRGHTPLIEAANYRNVAAAEELLKLNADVHAHNDESFTALRYACTRKNPEMIRLLIAHGADPNERYINGQTPLMAAVSAGATIEIIEILLKAGADINTVNEFGYAALIFAITSSNFNIAQYLINSGAAKNIELPPDRTVKSLIDDIAVPETREKFRQLFA